MYPCNQDKSIYFRKKGLLIKPIFKSSQSLFCWTFLTIRDCYEKNWRSLICQKLKVVWDRICFNTFIAFNFVFVFISAKSRRIWQASARCPIILAKYKLLMKNLFIDNLFLSFSKPLSTCGRISCNNFWETFVWRGIIPKWCSHIEGLTWISW